ncbi:MAG: PSD1 and planctomycete cytochrome C domain-containing protein [Planctomycetaceae bacterium]
MTPQYVLLRQIFDRLKANTAIGLTVVGVLIFLTPSTTAQSTEPTAAEKLFALKVRPLLQEKCVACHGQDADKVESGFVLTSRDALLAGGESFGEAVIVPGKAEDSALYAMVKRTEPDFAMPPKESEKLTQQETWWIRDWINGGAPWPDEKRLQEIYDQYAEGVTWSTRGGLSDEWTRRKYKPESLWAWQPLWQDDGSTLNGLSGSAVIDCLIGDRLRDAGLVPAELADRRTLIRRATFDLLGLPPAPDEVAAFVDDERSDQIAFHALLDRLLASPHYGEQWGRHWLDVVRYADSSGFANDWERPNAWRYRDYVIRAFNDDKPYDQFVKEQLAGDEIDPDDSEKLIATGFLRMGPWEQTGMSVAKVTRQQFLDDVTDSVGQVFLGHALQCCRCHDHKFDPVPTQDYYAFQAVFATTQFAEVDAPWLPAENLAGMDEDRHYLNRKQKANADMLSDLSRKKAANEREWFQKQGLPYKTRKEAKEANAPKEHFPPNNLLTTPDDFGQERIGRKWQQRFPWEADRYLPIAFTVYSGRTRYQNNASSRFLKPQDDAAGVVQQTYILTGGDPFAPGDEVVPAALSAVPNSKTFHVPNGVSGRRTALANWITSPDNPLAARVMVNRIWHYHFGRGIAANPNNFGATGKPPTHPELLDWLANEFMDNDWSVKHIHKLIMMSETYRRSSRHADPESLAGKDSANQLYAVFQPRRLAAEELRDTMLAVSGELNPAIGGIPIRPDMNMEAALQPRMIMGTFAPAYVPNPKPADRNRRTVYALKLRGHRDPMLETFNQPGSEKSCEVRDTSTISPQALTLLNSEESADRALAFAAHVRKQTDTEDDAVQLIFQRAFGRLPTADETKIALQHWAQMEAVQAALTFEPRTYPTEIVRQASEENTGEPFRFTERLFVYEDYIPDLQPHQVDAKTRALADVCLAILNSNEFVFVY